MEAVSHCSTTRSAKLRANISLSFGSERQSGYMPRVPFLIEDLLGQQSAEGGHVRESWGFLEALAASRKLPSHPKNSAASRSRSTE
jgi:hypothetical protein